MPENKLVSGYNNIYS